MPTDVSASLPQLDLGPGATVAVDTGDPAALVTSLTVYGTYYPPGTEPPQDSPLWLPRPGAGA